MLNGASDNLLVSPDGTCLFVFTVTSEQPPLQCCIGAGDCAGQPFAAGDGIDGITGQGQGVMCGNGHFTCRQCFEQHVLSKVSCCRLTPG